MIHGFFKVVQDDVNLIVEEFNTYKQGSTINPKVGRAALRVFAAFGMVFASGVAVKAVAIYSGAYAVVVLAEAAFYYALFHDIFVISKNIDQSILGMVCPTARAICSDIYQFFVGEKTINEGLRNPYHEGTIFQPLWDKIRWEILRLQAGI